MDRNFDPVAFWDKIENERSKFWPVVCVDFNGVCDQYGGWNGKVEDYPPAKDLGFFLRALRIVFNTIIIFTATIPVSTVEEWFIENGFDHMIDAVTNFKVPAKVYIDDRAVTFKGNFKETLEEVIRFKAHWED